MIYLSVEKLKKNPNNPRIIKDEGFLKLKESLQGEKGKEMFEARPCIVSNRTGENIIIAGNTRYQAAKDLGWKEVPTVILEGLTEEQEEEIIIRDNVSNGSWDWEKLANEWESEKLVEWGLDVPEIESLDEEEVQEDDFDAEPPKEPVTKRGDVYTLGNHRVMCGDSTIIDDVEKLMDGEKADMVFTSPPYNANTKVGDGDIFKKNKSKKLYGTGYADDLESKEYVDFVKKVLVHCFIYTEGFIFWNVSYNSNSRFEYIKQIEDYVGFLIEQICWKKSARIPFKGSLMRDWEPIYVFSTNHKMLGLKSVVSNFWEISNTNSQQKDHKACYPVALPVKAISLVYSKIVLDPFLGSGSTLIACEQTGRKCYGMELDERYVDVIIRRYIKYCKDNNKEPMVQLNGQVLTNLEQYE